jgi:hypothetical protein
MKYANVTKAIFVARLAISGMVDPFDTNDAPKLMTRDPKR